MKKIEVPDESPAMPDAERMRLRRQNDTPEAKSVRIQKQRERQATLRTDLTDL